MLDFAHPTFEITVNIDGRIDLGPKWNYEINISTDKVPQQYKLLETAIIRTNKNTDSELVPYSNSNAILNNTKLNITNNYFDFDLSKIFESNENTTNVNKEDEPITQSLSSINDRDFKTIKEIAQIKERINQLNKTKPVTENIIRTKHNSSRLKNEKPKKTRDEQETFSDHENFKFDDQTTKKKKTKRNRHKDITRGGYVSRAVYRARKVKEDTKVYDFTVHIYKQTLKVFDGIEKKTDNEKLKRKVSALKRSYKERFGDFLKQTYNHTLKTKLGKQKVILNTIDMSNKLLQRLVNHLLHDMDREILRTNLGTVNVFQKEVDKEKAIENIHACKKLGVCRQNDDFSDFLVEILRIIIQTDDTKVKQAMDALVEAYLGADFDEILEPNLQIKFKKGLGKTEVWDAFMSRAMFVVLRNIIKNKNKPIVVMNQQDNVLANKTIALYDIINILNEKLPKSENEKEWAGMKKDLVDWSEGRHNNISLIANSYVNHVVEKALRKLDYDTRAKINESMAVLLSHIN
ncbi:unnamed protein product [Colias eurytheme]|nr:unnamed protein product [Colias eurytheme]